MYPNGGLEDKCFPELPFDLNTARIFLDISRANHSLKRFVYAMIYSDVCGYDLTNIEGKKYAILQNSYKEQKHRYFKAYSGRQMGYGQGYITETALMFDEVEDYTDCVEACAYLYGNTSKMLCLFVTEGVEREKFCVQYLFPIPKNFRVKQIYASVGNKTSTLYCKIWKK